jgi:hypothetical protein
MTKRFETFMMGEQKFFLRFQIKQLKEGTFLSQTKYTHDMLKKFDMVNAKPIKLPCQPMDILISTKKGKPWIPRYIVP